MCMKPEKIKEMKTKAVETAVDQVLELGVKPVKEVIKNIEVRLNTPADEAVDAVGQLTTKQQLIEVVKKYGKEAAFNALKKVENIGIGALQLIPVLGSASTELVDAAILEGATASQAKALATGANVVGKGEIVYPLTHLIGETGAKKLDKVLKALDPHPDVDPRIVMAFGVAGTVVPGVGAVPAALELTMLNFKDIKNAASATKEVGSIITKSPELASAKLFAENVIKDVGNRIQSFGKPQMVSARAAFGVA